MAIDAQKLIKLAFHSSTYENEAINAFLALRRQPGIDKAISANKKEQLSITYAFEIPARQFDYFLRCLSSYSTKPYFVFSKIDIRTNLMLGWKLDVTAYFDTQQELTDFINYTDNLIVEMRYM